MAAPTKPQTAAAGGYDVARPQVAETLRSVLSFRAIRARLAGAVKVRTLIEEGRRF